MATLQSPGVQVTVVDESFYTPAAPGTVPLIFVASAQDKLNPSGNVAQGTTAANAGKVYLITSQRDLADTFGIPQFYTDANNNPIHGGEQNEYGLQAAYSLLGVSSAAYVVRAPVDLSALTATSSVPAGNPADGQIWLDTANTTWGVFEWDGTTFVNKTPIVIDNSNYGIYTENGDGETPAASIGKAGDYAFVVTGLVTVSGVETNINTNSLWYKNSDGNWVLVGSVGETWDGGKATAWKTSWPVVTATAAPATVTATGAISINDEPVTIATTGTVATVAATINAAAIPGVHARVIGGALNLYADDDAKSNGVTSDGKILISSSSTALMSQLGLSNGSYNATRVFVGPHTQYPNFSNAAKGSVYVKTTSPNAGQIWEVKKWTETTETWDFVKAPVYSNDTAATYNLDKVGGGANIPVGTVYVEGNFEHGNNTYVDDLYYPVTAKFKLKRRAAVSPTTITSAGPGTITPTNTVTNTRVVSVAVSQPGVATYSAFTDIEVEAGPALNLVVAINNAGIANLSARPNADGTISITHDKGGEILFKDITALTQAGFAGAGVTANLYDIATGPDGASFIASNWEPLTYEANDVPPSSTPADGQLWYDAILDQVDIMTHDGEKWVGYRNMYPDTDIDGPFVGATRPTAQRDGTALANGDIWISLANGADSYGKEVYTWDANLLQWVPVDVTDQTSPDGILFADARWSNFGQDTQPAEIADLLVSNYVDPDAPDPAEYPRGMKLWNLRRSGFNVKQYVKNYIDINANNGYNIRVPGDQMADPNSPYNPDRWVSVSPNNEDGSGTFGRHAQRSYVVKALKAEIDGNTSVRDTDRWNYNLIVCPGYVETTGNLVSLNVDRGLTAFVIGDSPFRLTPDATSLNAWATNANGAFDNGDTGAVSYNQYLAMYYPSGYTNDLSGNYIVVPPSHMMLRTYALSDQQSYPWFAPAGIRRGVVDNATSVGYIEAQTGEFKLASLPENIRNVMYEAKLNPIATLNGVGIVAYGQKTRANAASALDRVNVARLVCYLRRQLDILAKPYLFEPNDKITRDELKNAAESLMLELVGQRALYDFIVVCDESNNTPDRIDRSELWMDIAIEPVKAVEFIYIPLRLKNTGEIAGLG